MKKKIFFLITLALTLCFVTGCGKTDASKFKEEYESLNGTTNKSGKVIRSITIDKDNPIVYSTAEEIVKKIEDKETFVVYFGFASCPWCRSVLPTLLDVSKDLKLDKIYYVDILNIRDSLILDDNGKLITETEGSEAYYKLLTLLDSVLSDYSMSYKDVNKIKKKKKRIYAPNVVGIANGKPLELTTGISSLQTDAYMELTPEMIKETTSMFRCVIKCVLESNNSCSLDKAC